eukprot:comp77321_c0_seq1/m.48268 comp77321_c0_seq1/g.48268  ORF comp77321_c0_seq1/g.48268 comp77321_c0_seq1/m.48268 type:complete len:226 (-) comp77321_c0_seq1:237-914(-)
MRLLKFEIWRDLETIGPEEARQLALQEGKVRLSPQVFQPWIILEIFVGVICLLIGFLSGADTSLDHEVVGTTMAIGFFLLFSAITKVTILTVLYLDKMRQVEHCRKNLNRPHQYEDVRKLPRMSVATSLQDNAQPSGPMVNNEGGVLEMAPPERRASQQSRFTVNVSSLQSNNGIGPLGQDQVYTDPVAVDRDRFGGSSNRIAQRVTVPERIVEGQPLDVRQKAS